MILKPTEAPNRGIIPKRMWICVPTFLKRKEDVAFAFDQGRLAVQHAARSRKCKIGEIDFRRNTDGSIARWAVPAFSKLGIPTAGEGDAPPGHMVAEMLDGSGRRAYTGPTVSAEFANGFIVFVQAQVFKEG